MYMYVCMYVCIPKSLDVSKLSNPPQNYYWTPVLKHQQGVHPRCFSKDSNSAPTMAAAARICPGCPGRFHKFHGLAGIQLTQDWLDHDKSWNNWQFHKFHPWFNHPNLGDFMSHVGDSTIKIGNWWWFYHPKRFHHQNVCVWPITGGIHLQMDPKCLLFRNFINSHLGSNVVLNIGRC